MRQIDVNRHLSGPKDGPCYQYISRQENPRLQGKIIRGNLVEEEGQAARIYPDAEEDPYADDHELDLPALAPSRMPKCALQVHQDEDGAGDDGKQPEVACPPQGEIPRAGLPHHWPSREPTAPEDCGEENRDDENGDDNGLPPVKELAVVRPAVGEAEEKPQPRQQRCRDRLHPIPQQEVPGLIGLQGQSRQDGIEGKERHARGKDP